MIALQVSDFLAESPASLVEKLAYQAVRNHRTNDRQQLRAWQITIDVLKSALADWPVAQSWQLVLEFSIRRLGRRIDAVIVTPKAVMVLEFKVGQTTILAQDRQQVEDYALDLQDFHAGSRGHTIVPILVATEAAPEPVVTSLLLNCITDVVNTGASRLGNLLRDLWRRLPEPQQQLDVADWARAPYRPVPGIVDAACTLFSRHGVDDIAAALADTKNLTVTKDAILNAITEARRDGLHLILFVTGIPGAGKTLCGLNAVFGAEQNAGATFLTGNPTLVHVLREALARDAAEGDRRLIRAARQQPKVSIQALPAFRDHHVRTHDRPAEHVAVIDEAQRAWARDHAVRKSVDREVVLTESEPAHLLDIMQAHQDWAVVVCLIGHGQEIHDGEGGLAEWGAALLDRQNWQVRAPAAVRIASDRAPASARGPARAGGCRAVPRRAHAQPAQPARFGLGRPDAGRQRRRRAGIGRKTRADAVPPDPRSRPTPQPAARRQPRPPSLRTAGQLRRPAPARRRAWARNCRTWMPARWRTGFSIAGRRMSGPATLWNRSPPSSRARDLNSTMSASAGRPISRASDRSSWLVRDFKGTRWQTPSGAEAIANRLNTYRVLLTRARYETVIWVPRGDTSDATRPPAGFNAIAEFPGIMRHRRDRSRNIAA